MAGQRTRPQNLNFGRNGHLGGSRSNGEAVRMSDLEGQGGYRPMHPEGRHSSILEHEAFVQSSSASPYASPNYDPLER